MLYVDLRGSCWWPECSHHLGGLIVEDGALRGGGASLAGERCMKFAKLSFPYGMIGI